jgi:CBS domain-containing protein
MQISIAEIMSKNIEIVDEFASVQEVATKMRDKNISSLIVNDSFGNAKGLVTERDLVRKICVRDIYTSKIKINEIMSSPLVTISPDEAASTATDIMLKHNIRHLLVVDDSTEINKAIGIVTPRDLARYMEFTRNDTDNDSLEKILEYFI